jgi:cobalt/nickel transport system permease protein
MHIPDGYLGPQTYLPLYGIMAPVWGYASLRVRRSLKRGQVPMLALGAAFSFVIMMFNVPIPGGTTGHAVGSVLVAILLGPWAAVLAVSTALAVQALLFADGGITALAANCFNMAFVMPFAGWWVYRILKGTGTGPKRRIAAAALAGYAGLNAAALSAGLMLGMQPLLAADPSGRPLYCPFGLGIAVPAMAIEHLALFGIVEALVTGLVLAYLLKADPSLVRTEVASKDGTAHPWRRLAWGMAVLVALTPLGLYLPAKFGAGSAWGEWSAEEIRTMTGYIPAGLAKLSEMWRAPLPEYGPKVEPGSFASSSAWYIVSALLGVCAICLVMAGMRWWIAKRGADG